MTLTVTKYSVKSNKLVSSIGCLLLLNRFLICIMVNNFATTKSFVQQLPLRFTRVNGINKAGKITLMGQDGVKWMVRLTNENKRGRMRLGSGWKGFCEAHNVKIGARVLFVGTHTGERCNSCA